MEIQITGRRIKLTPAIAAYLQEKLGKAQKYFDHIIWGQAFLGVEKNTHTAELVVHAAHQTFRARSDSSDLYSAIDLATDKIDVQLKKYKERLKNHHKASLPEIEEVALGAIGPRFSVFKQPVRPMTPGEAAREMERLGQNFRLFEDKESRQISLLYRRDGNSYGILQPLRTPQRS